MCEEEARERRGADDSCCLYSPGSVAVGDLRFVVTSLCLLLTWYPIVVTGSRLIDMHAGVMSSALLNKFRQSQRLLQINADAPKIRAIDADVDC